MRYSVHLCNAYESPKCHHATPRPKEGSREGECPLRQVKVKSSFNARSQPNSTQAKTADLVDNVGGDTVKLSLIYVLDYEITGVISYCTRIPLLADVSPRANITILGRQALSK